MTQVVVRTVDDQKWVSASCHRKAQVDNLTILTPSQNIFRLGNGGSLGCQISYQSALFLANVVS